MPYVEQFMPLRDRRILDIGCGQGGVSFTLSDGNEVVGLDISLERMAWRPRLDRPPLILLASGLAVPCCDNSFDVVILSDVMEHVNEPSLMLYEVNRVLRPGGIAFFSFTPYYGPRGGHVWNYVPLPYIHFVLPDSVAKRLIKGMGDLGPLATSARLLTQYESLNRLRISEFLDYCSASNLGLLWEQVDTLCGWKLRRNSDLLAMEYIAVFRKSPP